MGLFDTLGSLGNAIGSGLEYANGVLGDLADVQGNLETLLGGLGPSPPPNAPAGSLANTYIFPTPGEPLGTGPAGSVSTEAGPVASEIAAPSYDWQPIALAVGVVALVATVFR